MSDFPYMRFYVSDYLGDTQHLTTIEHGAYFLLLIALWNAPDNTLPNDDKMLARYARMTNGQWRKVAPVLMPLFEVSGGVLRPGAAKSPVDWSVHPSEWGIFGGQISGLLSWSRAKTDVPIVGTGTALSK